MYERTSGTHNCNVYPPYASQARIFVLSHGNILPFEALVSLSLACAIASRAFASYGGTELPTKPADPDAVASPRQHVYCVRFKASMCAAACAGCHR